MKYLAVLGRQANISLAELESLFSHVEKLSPKLATFSLKSNSPVDQMGNPDIDRLGGTMKLAKEISDPLKYIIDDINNHNISGKIVIGISDYSKKASVKSCQMLAMSYKTKLIKTTFSSGKKPSVRILFNKHPDLSTATVFHNSLGKKPGHYEIIRFSNSSSHSSSEKWFVGIGVQNINAYTARDQARPARDAKVGMLPPKLAQILINLCGPLKKGATILDPFCGTGVVLQEAYLMGYHPYGTDINERIVSFSEKNLKWLIESKNSSFSRTYPTNEEDSSERGPITMGDSERSRKEPFLLSVADATNFTWKQPLDAIACEGYLGPPMSQPPVEIKLKTVMQDCKTIIIGFLKNLSGQLQSNTPIVMAIPAWLRPDGHYQKLNILDEIERLGYNVEKYKNTSQEDLLYYRDGQVVAREIIVLRKK